MKLNRRSELDARTFEEYLISGLPIYKISWAYRRGKLDVFTDYVNPNFVFFPDSLDFNLQTYGFVVSFMILTSPRCLLCSHIRILMI